MEQLESQAQLPVRSGAGPAGDEFLLLVVAVREPTAAERETGKPALLNQQILIRRRWPEELGLPGVRGGASPPISWPAQGAGVPVEPGRAGRWRLPPES